MINPYAEMIKIMREEGQKHNPLPVMMGEVVSTSPLLIKTGGLQLDSDNLLICQGSGYQYFLPGDRVVLLPMLDKQTFILIDKVVSL